LVRHYSFFFYCFLLDCCFFSWCGFLCWGLSWSFFCDFLFWGGGFFSWSGGFFSGCFSRGF
jgi:hypothetical protein